MRQKSGIRLTDGVGCLMSEDIEVDGVRTTRALFRPERSFTGVSGCKWPEQRTTGYCASYMHIAKGGSYQSSILPKFAHAVIKSVGPARNDERVSRLAMEDHEFL